jgi:hypothetical protein
MYETTNFLIRIRNIISPKRINIEDTINEMAKEESVEENDNSTKVVEN